MKARAILFDLDGVIADSTHAVEASWRAWAARHGIAAGASVVRVTGNDGAAELGEATALIRTFDDVELEVCTCKNALLTIRKRYSVSSQTMIDADRRSV